MFDVSSLPQQLHADAVSFIEGTLCRLLRGITKEHCRDSAAGPLAALQKAAKAFLAAGEGLVGHSSLAQCLATLLALAEPEECGVPELRQCLDKFAADAKDTAEDGADLEDEDEVDGIFIALQKTKGGKAVVENAQGVLGKREKEFELEGQLSSLADTCAAAKDFDTVLSSQFLSTVRTELQVLTAREKLMSEKQPGSPAQAATTPSRTPGPRLLETPLPLTSESLATTRSWTAPRPVRASQHCQASAV